MNNAQLLQFQKPSGHDNSYRRNNDIYEDGYRLALFLDQVWNEGHCCVYGIEWDEEQIDTVK